MSSSERDKVHQIMQNTTRGNSVGQQLKWNPSTKRIEVASHSDPDRTALEITPSDMKHFGLKPKTAIVTIYAETLKKKMPQGPVVSYTFHRWDGGDAYTEALDGREPGCIPGSLTVDTADSNRDISSLGMPDDQIRIVAALDSGPEASAVQVKAADRWWRISSYVKNNDNWDPTEIQVIPLKEDLFSRTRGLFETDILANVRVLTGGLGSGGAPICLEFAKLGLSQILMDHDRIEVANVVRHVAGLSDVGRHKTKVMAEKIRDKNPYAELETYEVKICKETEELLRELVRRCDLGVCAVDDPDARLIWNRIFVEENKPYIMAANFRRAYGGQVLFVRPGKTLCYQCFRMGLPEVARDREISIASQAQRHAYSDRPVAIEPGLSNDIAPISQMVVKLAIQFLLAGKSSTLRSLDEDLTAPWYLWLNRREAKTQYEGLPPLTGGMDGMRICRWYGIPIEPEPACPCCGDFVNAMADNENIQLVEQDAAAFMPAEIRS
ncbi:MAG: ThiF family adenylyltransferase [Phycisphaerae bacterium]|nr:ThiF family adenylyltransferase [Phycisphaerae bacterium]